ncbi:AcrR family transcriptional regulator [Actinoplanes lutulentus]|uniref:TetR family transcriptional regulator n=1 Tax=Actinoplanes lutulentus TaxID=1287878 RepID=A0A327ZM39_9ACTN|nr:TetR/AcrR family transcriptional regulator [Actinoplanes lutulentus]MBB2940887.1 AcrR family transcriptional regulator [Actinoplanes lutulentus]RAK43196.1 TetR family transcriptional regulator [Actinoplanes lutulentus]
MPKIVDHEARRNEIVEAFLAVVTRAGMPAATSRATAAELGVGTGALWHYFDGFDDVAAAAYQRISERTNARLAASTAGRRGLDAVHAMLREIYPLEKETVEEAYVVVGFWGRLAANERIGAGKDVAGHWSVLVRDHLVEAVQDGELVPETPVDDVSDVLFAVGMGQQAFAVMRSPLSAPARQLSLIEHCLIPWRTPGFARSHDG